MSLTFVNQVGAVNGLNQASPGVFIPETFVRWAQDVLFDRVGYLRRRAPFSVFKLYNNATPPVETYPSITNERVVGVASTNNPNGDKILALILTRDSPFETRALLYDSNFRNTGSSTLAAISSTAVIDFKAASTTGMWLSFLESYKTATGANEYFQYYWHGGCGTEHTISSVKFGCKHTDNVKHRTFTNIIYAPTSGSFDTTKITSGMFVYVTYGGADYYVGMVKSFESAFVTLEKDIIRWVYDTPIASLTGVTITGTTPNERAEGLTISFKNFRPYIHQHGRGLITRATASTTTVTSGSVGTEGEGHFNSADLAGISLGIKWGMYRASDNEWIGDISSVTDNAALTLDTDHHSHEADVILRADEYVCWPYTSVPSATKTNEDATDFAGIFNASYAGLQWYANAANTTDSTRLVFSAPHNDEAVDLSKDSADSIIIPGEELRGIATSSSGLIVFTNNKTFILRGNYRSNFSLEELYPEGCLSAMSIVEYGGGVFWASRIGLMFYDGASVRNLTENNLGVYYTDSVRTFNVTDDRIYSFFHKDYLFTHFTAFDSPFKPLRYEPVYADGIETTPAIADFEANDWDPDFTSDDFLVENNVPVYWDTINMYESIGAGSTNVVPVWGSAGTTYKWGSAGTQYVWGPIQQTQGITFALYLPTNALTTLSNFDFRSATKIDSISGVKALMGSNIVYATDDVRPRIIDVDSILETSNQQDTSIDDALIENNGKEDAVYIKGPDFYLQTKHFSVGDPILRKWFKQIMLNLYLLDGAVRMDVVDMEDNDRIDIEKKRHKNWEVFEEAGYSWTEFEDISLPKVLSPNRSTWTNVQALNKTWYEISDSEFTRRRKKISWRYPSAGFRLYQMNEYRPANYQEAQRPHTIMVDAWNIGFRPMRASRV